MFVSIEFEIIVCFSIPLLCCPPVAPRVPAAPHAQNRPRSLIAKGAKLQLSDDIVDVNQA